MSTRSPLDLDQPTMQRLGRQVADLVAEHLATLSSQPVIAGDLPATVRHQLSQPPSEGGMEFDGLLETLRTDVLSRTAREPHPGFMGYVPSCPTFPAILGDWLATGYNVFAGVWSIAEGPNAIELAVLDWFRQWIGMPEGAGGLLTSGGSSATLTAIVAARHAVVGEDASRLARLTLYTSDQAHSAVVRAAWIAGVPRGQVRVLPSDKAFRLRPADVRAAMAADRAAGLVPLAVVASAGTTNTGAVDPLDELADLCAAEKVWLHVDAAYGGFATLTPRGRELLAGLGRCDSVALDPHKWLYVPIECGCLLVRDPARLREAFQILPDYLLDVAPVDRQVNFADYGEQLTRQARGLKIWLNVRYFGLAALRTEIENGIARAEHIERMVREEPALELLAPAQLGVVCFRVRPPDMDDPAELDAFNERVNTAVNATGRHLISSTRLRGVFSLRACVLGFRTSMAEVEAMIRSVLTAAGQLHPTLELDSRRSATPRDITTAAR